MINRRSFFGSVLGFFGLGSCVQARKKLPKTPVGAWSQNWWDLIEPEITKRFEDCDTEKPNFYQSWRDLAMQAAEQMEQTGTVLIWMVPNKLGRVCEMHVLPSALAIPYPAIQPDYPDGYYRIASVFPATPHPLYPNQSVPSTVIAAQWVLRIVEPYENLRRRVETRCNPKLLASDIYRMLEIVK